LVGGFKVHVIELGQGSQTLVRFLQQNKISELKLVKNQEAKMKYLLCITLISMFAFRCAKGSLPDDTNREPVSATPTGGSPVLPAPTGPITPNAKIQAMQDIQRMDPKGVVPANLMMDAVLYFNQNIGSISNHSVIGVVDFSLHSSKPRFYIINVNGSGIRVVHVAHGLNSDPKNTGYATLFGNVNGSEKSSLGFYLTGEQIQHNGVAHVLNGLSSTNSNARQRAIWLHAAAYVMESSVQPGRSWGCLAVAYSVQNFVMSSFGSGGLIYVGLSKE
jgi:hypothetical protein